MNETLFDHRTTVSPGGTQQSNPASDLRVDPDEKEPRQVPVGGRQFESGAKQIPPIGSARMVKSRSDVGQPCAPDSSQSKEGGFVCLGSGAEQSAPDLDLAVGRCSAAPTALPELPVGKYFPDAKGDALSMALLYSMKLEHITQARKLIEIGERGLAAMEEQQADRIQQEIDSLRVKL